MRINKRQKRENIKTGDKRANW